MTPTMKPLLPLDKFRFECNEAVSCFNACCRDLNQFLTPYDILRLKNSLGMISDEFLEAYATIHIGPHTGLPVASLRPAATGGHPCPFVSPDGCMVYADRPSSCRMYPVARLVSRSRETGQTTAHFALLKEAHCQGFDQGPEWTAADWMANQGLEPYNAMNDQLMEIIALKNQRLPGPLSLAARRIFHLALYDLDAFRIQVFEKGFLRKVAIDPECLEQAKTDDKALLEMGLYHIRESLFGTDDESKAT